MENGGKGCTTCTAYAKETNHGFDGESGEDCGTVRILGSLDVYAYGGGGRLRWS